MSIAVTGSTAIMARIEEACRAETQFRADVDSMIFDVDALVKTGAIKGMVVAGYYANGQKSFVKVCGQVPVDEIEKYCEVKDA